MTWLWLDWTITWLSCDLTELWLDWAVTWLSCDLTELWLDWAVTWQYYLTGLSYDLTELWLDCDLTELWLDWTITWLSCDLTELWLDWAVTWLSCDLTELWLDWAATWLSCDLTELWLDWAVTWLSCDLTELWLDWAVTWLSCDLTELWLELWLDWAVTWLSCDLTELWRGWAITLRSCSYIGSFSTKLPLIMYPERLDENVSLPWRFTIPVLRRTIFCSQNAWATTGKRGGSRHFNKCITHSRTHKPWAEKDHQGDDGSTLGSKPWSNNAESEQEFGQPLYSLSAPGPEGSEYNSVVPRFQVVIPIASFFVVFRLWRHGCSSLMPP